jgi:hypothetical protein
MKPVPETSFDTKWARDTQHGTHRTMSLRLEAAEQTSIPK